MIDDEDKSVYILLYRDLETTNVVSVFSSLHQSNEECIRLALEAGVTLERESPTNGPDAEHLTPMEPLRWDTNDGISCWVEQHAVRADRIIPTRPDRRQPDRTTDSPPAQRREDSELYGDGPRYDDIVVDRKCFPAEAAQAEGPAVSS